MFKKTVDFALSGFGIASLVFVMLSTAIGDKLGELEGKIMPPLEVKELIVLEATTDSFTFAFSMSKTRNCTPLGAIYHDGHGATYKVTRASSGGQVQSYPIGDFTSYPITVHGTNNPEELFVDMVARCHIFFLTTYRIYP